MLIYALMLMHYSERVEQAPDAVPIHMETVHGSADAAHIPGVTSLSDTPMLLVDRPQDGLTEVERLVVQAHHNARRTVASERAAHRAGVVSALNAEIESGVPLTMLLQQPAAAVERSVPSSGVDRLQGMFNKLLTNDAGQNPNIVPTRVRHAKPYSFIQEARTWRARLAGKRYGRHVADTVADQQDKRRNSAMLAQMLGPVMTARSVDSAARPRTPFEKMGFSKKLLVGAAAGALTIAGLFGQARILYDHAGPRDFVEYFNAEPETIDTTITTITPLMAEEQSAASLSDLAADGPPIVFVRHK